MPSSSDWAGKRVLVTGAAGFIGSHLVETLVERGAHVRALVRYNSRGSRGNLEYLEPSRLERVGVVSGDLRDADTVLRAVRDCAIVFHLGALIAIPYSYQNPSEFVQTNVVGTANVLNACRENAALERVVLTSTSEVYGTAQYVPIDERHPLQGQSPYSATKIAADHLGESYYRAFDLPVAILRPFNTFGPRQSARAIVPTIITQALTRGRLELGSLWPERDLTYVADTVDGFLAIALAAGVEGTPINIGTGQAVSVGRLVELVGAQLGRTLEVETAAERVRPDRSEVGRLVAATERAQQAFGWRPRYTLEEGLRAAISWIETHLDDYRPSEYHV